ncbi:MAG: peptidylprolyl isomerase [Clostridia bacterium]|nr:peptidylprolyl isomerase [Clostridia bacterium]
MKNNDILNTENNEKQLKKKKRIQGSVIALILVVFIFYLIFGFLGKPNNFRALNYAQLIKDTPKITDAGVAIRINDTEIEKEVWDYYFMREAQEYAENNNLLLGDVDWDKETVNSQTVLEKAKYDATVKLISDMAVCEKAPEWGIALTDEDRKKTVDIDVRLGLFGESSYELLGIKDDETYYKIRDILILKDKVREEVSLNIDKYFADTDLTLFASDKSATVRVIEIPIGEGKVHRANAYAKAEEIRERLLKGDDFDTVWKEVARAYVANQDDMESPMIATIYKDSVAAPYKNMETAALSAKIDEISDIVETDYSFMVIKRVKGYTEVINKLIKESDISINKELIEKSEI